MREPPIPDCEFQAVIDFVTEHRRHHTQQSIAQAYERHGLSVLASPYAPEITAAIREALVHKRPYSVVRIGDGEANILTYLTYPGTPTLDRVVACQIIAAQEQRFRPSGTWLLTLRELMRLAVASADIVGVRGLWWGPQQPKPAESDHATRPTDPSILAARVRSDPRGGSGVSRAEDSMVRLAASGGLDGKIIASAHLYLAVLEGLQELIGAAQAVLLITSRAEILNTLKQAWPEKRIDCIPVGRSPSPAAPGRSRDLPRQPGFLRRVHDALAQDLAGTLCLIGAGPWSEIYCTFVKERGGVGVDLGSGFDLLSGRITRPIHRALQLDVQNTYELSAQNSPQLNPDE